MKILAILMFVLLIPISSSGFSDYRDHDQEAQLVFFEEGVRPCYSLQMVDKYIYRYNLIYEFIGCGGIYECFVSKHFGTYYHNDYTGVERVFTCYFYDSFEE